MDPIDFHGSFFSVPSKPLEKKKASRGKGGARFSELLSSRMEEEAAAGDLPAAASRPADEIQIGEALDSVHILGGRLKKNPTLAAIAEYKEAIAHFLRLAIDTSYEVKEHVYTSKRNKMHKRDVQVSIINEKVEKLAAQIMKSQKDELEILRRVDEIYGLLVDLQQ